MMKKFIAVLLSAIMIIGLFASCGATEKSEKKLSIVTTIFPEYDWVKNILGEKLDDADLTMLLDSGVDLHSFQPTADDIIKISACDLFIYVGGESDSWVNDALNGAVNKNMKVINLLEVLGDSAKEEEIVEGMQAEEEEEEGEEGPEYDEHVWLSLKNSAVLVGAIRDSLISIDGENAETYKSNADSYIEKINALDAEYSSAIEGAKLRTILFADRFPFRYLVDDYGIDYYAAFVGCSAESEASFETIAFLAGKVDELKLGSVLTLEGTDHKIAETVIQTTESKSARIISMDSMQSITSEDVGNGADYLALMEKNLEVLKEALN